MVSVVRDVGLSLRRIRSERPSVTARSSVACDSYGGTSCMSSPCLPCGRLLQRGNIDSCSFDDLRRPATIVNLGASADSDMHESLSGRGVLMLHFPLETKVEEYNTGSPDVRSWSQNVVRLFEREDLEFPVLLQCPADADQTAVVVALLLLVLGVPEAHVIRQYLLSTGREEAFLRKALAGISKMGGCEAYLAKTVAGGGKGVNVALVRSRFVYQAMDSCMEDRATSEVQWLRQDAQLMCRLAQAAVKLGVEDIASFWHNEIVGASAELANLSLPQDAVAALVCKGWALMQLERAEEAHTSLSIGAALAQRCEVKPQVQKRLDKELQVLSYQDVAELRLLGVEEAVDGSPGDPHVKLMLIEVDTDGGDSAGWRALQCPDAFSWLRPGELAASATPRAEHLPALKALNLSKRVSAELLGAPGPPDTTHWLNVVSKISEVLATSANQGCVGCDAVLSAGCLLHCTDGFSSSGVALACFLVLHGMDEPIREEPGQPRMTAGEAIEVVRAYRSGSISTSEAEEQVQQFAQSAWAKHIESTQRAFSRPAASSSAAPPREVRKAPAGARVLSMPGDGNCLFHSLAHGFGSTASTLRGEICGFMGKSPELSIAGTSLADWIQMLAGQSLEQYSRKMLKSTQWGGAPEIAACSHLKSANIHVYEKRGGCFELTVLFDVPGASKTVNVLYVGGVHYDALIIP